MKHAFLRQQCDKIYKTFACRTMEKKKGEVQQKRLTQAARYYTGLLETDWRITLRPGCLLVTSCWPIT